MFEDFARLRLNAKNPNTSEAQTPDKYSNLIHKRKQEGLITEDAVCKGK